MFFRKPIIIAGVLIFLAGASYGGYRYFYASPASTATETTHESEVVSGEFVDAIRATGTAKLAYEQKLRFS